VPHFEAVSHKCEGVFETPQYDYLAMAGSHKFSQAKATPQYALTLNKLPQLIEEDVQQIRRRTEGVVAARPMQRRVSIGHGGGPDFPARGEAKQFLICTTIAALAFGGLHGQPDPSPKSRPRASL